MIESLNSNIRYDCNLTNADSNTTLEYTKPKLNYLKDKFSLSKDNGCTDGKDDGKIGFKEAIKNIAEGAGQSFIDIIKGCFSDNNGEFSLKKTLITAGIVTAGVLFPPFGLAACAVGVTSGAIKFGKGAYNALIAKNDEDAKKAWQNVGNGVLTAGISTVGIKSSYSSMKIAANAEKNTGVINVINVEKNCVTNFLNSLFKDTVSSTNHGVRILHGNSKLGNVEMKDIAISTIQPTPTPSHKVNANNEYIEMPI